MGWSLCGEDSRGRAIGYGVDATCDHPGCDKQIDRGLGYKCGPMHGEDFDQGYCESYFCGDHLFMTIHGQRCARCAARTCPACEEEHWEEPRDYHVACGGCGSTGLLDCEFTWEEAWDFEKGKPL